MDLYVEKQLISTSTAKKTNYLGSKVVLFMVSCLDDPNNHKFYVGNFFLSYALFAGMRFLFMSITGTVRPNKISKWPLKDRA